MGSTQCCHVPTLHSGSFWTPLNLSKPSRLTDQKLARRKLRQLPEPRAPKWIKYDRRLQKIADYFESYTNVLDYLEAVGNMTICVECGLIIILYLVHVILYYYHTFITNYRNLHLYLVHAYR